MYTINDKIEVKRHHDQPARKGIVTKGPFKVPGERLEHYHVKWEDVEYQTIETLFSTQKYKYRLQEGF